MNSCPLIQIPHLVTAITVPVVNGPAVTNSITPQTTTGVPSSFVAAAGDAGVRHSLASLEAAGTAAVAYLSPAYTGTFLAPHSTVATSSGALQLPIASLYNKSAAAYYAPTYSNATMAVNTTPAPSSFQAVISANYLSNSSGHNLDINNGICALCTGR